MHMNEKNTFEGGMDLDLTNAEARADSVAESDESAGSEEAPSASHEQEGAIPNFEDIQYVAVSPSVEMTMVSPNQEENKIEEVLREDDVPVLEFNSESGEGSLSPEEADTIIGDLSEVRDALPQDILLGETSGEPGDAEHLQMEAECVEIDEFRSDILDGGGTEEAEHIAKRQNLETLLAVDPDTFGQRLRTVYDKAKKWLNGLTKDGGKKIRAAALAGIAAVGAVQAGEAAARDVSPQDARIYAQQEARARAEEQKRIRQINAARAARDRQRAAEEKQREAQERVFRGEMARHAENVLVKIPAQQAREERTREYRMNENALVREADTRFRSAKGELDRWLQVVTAQLRQEGRMDEIADAKEAHRQRLAEIRAAYEEDKQNIRAQSQYTREDLRHRNTMESELARMAGKQIRGWITGR